MSVSRLDRAALVWGTVFVVLGMAFLLQELGLWQVRAEILMPLLLMLAGVLVIATGLGRRSS
jgi:hypothetical protein